MGFLQAAQQKHLSCHCFPLYSIFFIPKHDQLFILSSILVIRSLWSLTCSEYFTTSITSRRECLIITIGTEDPIILRSEWHVYQRDLREGEGVRGEHSHLNLTFSPCTYCRGSIVRASVCPCTRGPTTIQLITVFYEYRLITE